MMGSYSCRQQWHGPSKDRMGPHCIQGLLRKTLRNWPSCNEHCECIDWASAWPIFHSLFASLCTTQLEAAHHTAHNVLTLAPSMPIGRATSSATTVQHAHQRIIIWQIHMAGMLWARRALITELSLQQRTESVPGQGQGFSLQACPRMPSRSQIGLATPCC